MLSFNLALIVGLLARISLSIRVHGVSDDLLHLYKPYTIDDSHTSYWRCLSDPSIILTYDQINDDYCDCPDGSDEPGTNACPYKAGNDFYCINEGHYPLYIPSLKLNDGVCDYDLCCDGSDELKSGACPDKCPEINSQFVEYESKVREDIAKAFSIKEQILESASQARNELEHELVALRQQIKQAEQKASLVKASVREYEIGQSSAQKKIELKLKDIEGVFIEYAATITAQSSKLEELESMLSNLVLNYNPNFNDQAVKSTIRRFQEYDTNKEPIIVSNGLKQQLSELMSSMSLIALTCRDITTDTAETNGIVPEVKRVILNYFFGVPIMQTKQDPLDSDNKDLMEINRELQSFRTKAKSLEQDLEKNYGPNDILRGLRTVSVDENHGGYNYHIDLTEAAYQDSTFLGRFLSFQDNKLLYGHGSKCWNGPNRSAVVELVCGAEPRIISISEPEKCEYLIQLASPIACEEFSRQELLQRFEIDYSKL